jgi:hypothetical protein
MMQIATLLLLCAVFAALVIVTIATALKSARVENLIGDVFSPWLQDPFETSTAPDASEPARLEGQGARPPVAAAPR